MTSKSSRVWLAAVVAAATLCFGAAAHAEGKVASIRAAELVQKSPQFAAGQGQIKSEFEQRRTELEAEAKRLAEDLQKFKREADLMSSDARAQAEKALNTRKIDFEYKERKFREDFTKRDRELTEGMMGRIKEVVTQVASERGVDVVVQDPVYAAPGIDITDEVLKRLQAKKP